MIRIAICDDSRSELKYLNKLIELEFKTITDDISIECFENGIALLNANSHNKFNVLFLDIDMPKISGFDIARDFFTRLPRVKNMILNTSVLSFLTF